MTKLKLGIFASLVTIILVSLLGVRELFLPGYFESHDGILHVMRLAHFDEALRAGQFPVRWLSTWMAGYGSPIFNFNYTFPFYLGSFLHAFGLSFQSGIEVLLITGYLLSGIFCFLFLKELIGNNLAATVGSILYTWAPYRFTNIFIRGALGEATSFLFLPLVFYLAVKTYKLKNGRLQLLSGFVWALFILTNNLIAAFGAFLFFIYLICLVILRLANLNLLKNSFFAFILGLGLSAFFWLPSLSETKFTSYLEVYGDVKNQFVSLASVLYSPWHYAYAVPSNQEFSMSFQIGLVQIAVAIITFIIFLTKFKKVKSILNFNAAFFILITIFSIFMSSGFASSIYKIILALSIISFPWRFLAVATFSLAIIAGIFIAYMKNFSILLAVSISFGVIFLYWLYSKIASWKFSETDSEYRNMIKTNINFLPDTEFLPKGAQYLKLLEERGPASLRPFFEDDTVRSKIENIQNKNLFHTANIVALQPTEIRANTFYFPGWKLYVDNQESLINKDQYGLIKFTVNSGSHDIRLILKNTPIRTLGNTISITTFLLLVFLLIRENMKRFKRSFLSKFLKILQG